MRIDFFENGPVVVLDSIELAEAEMDTGLQLAMSTSEESASGEESTTENENIEENESSETGMESSGSGEGTESGEAGGEGSENPLETQPVEGENLEEGADFDGNETGEEVFLNEKEEDISEETDVLEEDGGEETGMEGEGDSADGLEGEAGEEGSADGMEGETGEEGSVDGVEGEAVEGSADEMMGMEGMDGMMMMDGLGGEAPSTPFLASWFNIVWVSLIVLVVGAGIGTLMGIKKAKKEVEDEN